METIPEYPKEISYKFIKKTINQMEKCICKIKVGSDENIAIFCKIPFPNESNLLPVLITTNLIINEELLYKKEESISIFILKEEEKKFDKSEKSEIQKEAISMMMTRFIELFPTYSSDKCPNFNKDVMQLI